VSLAQASIAHSRSFVRRENQLGISMGIALGLNTFPSASGSRVRHTIGRIDKTHPMALVHGEP
jgi:hypothetical protein